MAQSGRNIHMEIAKRMIGRALLSLESFHLLSTTAHGQDAWADLQNKESRRSTSPFCFQLSCISSPCVFLYSSFCGLFFFSASTAEYPIRSFLNIQDLHISKGVFQKWLLRCLGIGGSHYSFTRAMIRER